MKTKLLLKFLTILFFASFFEANAQVGINTTTPAGGSLLDVESSDKGILIPRVDIIDLNTIAPVTGGATESLLVYNTNAITGRGFYYWDSSRWVPIGTDNDDWNILGNTGTNQATNFIGTTDGQGLTVRTNNTQRFRFNTNNQLLAMSNGTAAAPSYSWSNDTTMGFYRSGTSQMDMVINGVSFYNANANIAPSENEWTFNPGGLDSNLRVETDNNSNAFFVDGQNDNIGLGTNAPNTSAQMEMADINKGLLINRVTLAATNSASPVSSPATGLLVYNTATAGTGANAVSPGFYYWDGSRWVALDGTNGRDWSLFGNNGTNPATNFLGTIDNVDLRFRTNNTERMRIVNDGRVSINGAPNFAGNRFTVNGAANESAINGFSTGTGTGVYGENTGSGIGIVGVGTTGYGVYGQTNTGVGIFSFASGAFPVFSSVAYNNHATGTAFLATGAGGSLTTVLRSAASFNGELAGAGVAPASGTGLVGNNNITNIVTEFGGSGIAGSGAQRGVFGYAGEGDVANANRGNYAGHFMLDADDDPTTNSGNNGTRAEAILASFNNVQPAGTGSAQDSYFGGYFTGGSQSSGSRTYAYVGMRYGTNPNGTAGTDYKVIGTGTVSTLINDNNNVPRIMFAPEAPEIVFQDFGTGQLINGEAYIELDPILKKSLHIDAKHPLKVYVTLEGDCNGVFVTNKSVNGFTVKELQGGTSNAPFSWQIVASRADTKDASGNVVSKHVGVRLPVGPGPIQSPPAKREKTKTLKKEIKEINKQR